MTTVTVPGGVLGHLCGRPGCGHPDAWHVRPVPGGYLPATAAGDERRACGQPGCLCYLLWPAMGPSLVHPAYDGETGERITYVIPPGQTEHGLRSCGCDDCDALYTRLTTTTTGASA